jgi:hypothetical protein
MKKNYGYEIDLNDKNSAINNAETYQFVIKAYNEVFLWI